jgi:hypothetical protein
LPIVDDEYDERSMLWSIIDDLPLGGDPSKFELCASVKLFGPEERQRPVPACCPHEDDHYVFDPHTSDLFSWYAIGLAVGLVVYFALFALLNGRRATAKVMGRKPRRPAG